MWKLSVNSPLPDDNLNVTLVQEFTETFQLSKFGINTIASFNSDKGLQDVSLCSISSQFYIIIAIDNKVYIYNESFELCGEFSFEKRCSNIILSEEFYLLLVIENSGTLHLLHIPTKQFIWSYVFEENGVECVIQNAFLVTLSESVVVCVDFKENNLFKILKVDAAAFVQALKEENVSELLNKFTFQEIYISSIFPNIVVKSSFETFFNMCPIGLDCQTEILNSSNIESGFIEDVVENEFSCDWEFNLEEDILFKIYDFSAYGKMIKVSSTRDGRYVVCLSEKHILLIFCSFTHAVIGDWGDEDIESFILSDAIDPDNFSVSDCKICILRKSKTGKIFEIRRFPSFDFVHKIQLSEFIHLIEGKPNQESWYFIEGKNMPANSEYPVQFDIKSLSESRPEVRLQGLLNRGKFKEAKKYAEMKNLNAEVIYKTEIDCMVKDYSANPTINLNDEHWKKLQHTLNQIKDVNFVKSCLESLTPKMDFMKKFLICINNWLAVVGDVEGAEDLIGQLNLKENKLLTYKILPASTSASLSLEDFLRKDLLQYMISELLASRLASSLVIWQRHKGEMLTSMTIKNVRDILDAISTDVPSDLLIPFLEEDFLLPVLCNVPEAVEEAADWITSHIYLFEINEKESWPFNGYKLAVMFLDLIQKLPKEGEKSAIGYSLNISVACIYEKLIKPNLHTGALFELSKKLKQLVYLKETFNCKIALNVFQESNVDIIFAVLEKINLKHLGDVISQFIRPFAMENDLDLDLCFELYIKDTFKKSNFTWWSWTEWDDPTSEERLVLILSYILNISQWVRSALLLISNASVPWSNRIRNIAEQGLNLNNSSKKDFEDQLKQVSLKEILLKYEIKHFPLTSRIESFDNLINHIIKINKPSAHEDIKNVMLVYNEALNSKCYFKLFQLYLHHKMLDGIISLLTSLPSNIAIDCCCSLLQCVRSRLEDSYLIMNDPDQLNTLLDAGLYFCEYLRNKKQSFDINLYNSLRAMQIVQKEFKVTLLLSDIMCKEKAVSFVEDLIKSTLMAELAASGKEISMKKISHRIFKINRLGDILNVERITVLGLLITKCLEENLYMLVIELSNELINSYPTTQSAETLMGVVEHFYQSFQNLKNVSFKTILEALFYLSNAAITYCDESTLMKYLPIGRLSTFFNKISKITGQQSILNPNVSFNDTYHKWQFVPMYDEEGFQLDIKIVLNFAVNLLALQTEKVVNEMSMEQSFHMVFKPLVKHMQERGQNLAAIQTIFFFQNFQQQEMEVLSDVGLISKELLLCLIQKIIIQKKLDLELSIGLLTCDDNPVSFLKNLEDWCSKDLRNVKALGEIGVELCNLVQNISESSEYDKMYRRAVLLMKQNVKPMTNKILLNSSDPEYNWQIIKDIVLNPNTSLPTVFECCNAFDLVTDHVLIAFLNNLLFEAEKQCINSLGTSKNDLSILKKVKCVIDEISDEELTVKSLESVLKKIGPYSYEISLFICEQILSMSANFMTISNGNYKKYIELLKFLSVYDRVSPPGDVEKDHWISIHPLDSNLPHISNKRIPLWLVTDDTTFQIIYPELNVNTLNVWLDIASLFNASKDKFAVITIKNHITAYLSKLPNKQFIPSQDMDLLNSIDMILKTISDYEMLVGIASWIANKMPPGPNKVAFCSLAVKYVEDWYKVCQNEKEVVNKYVKSMSNLHRKSAIEKILYQHSLANDVTLSYTHDPVKLITYFTEEYCFSPDSSIKVCKIAAELSEIVNLNLAELFSNFFYIWLNTDEVSQNVDETIVFNDFSQDNSFDNGDIKGNILRALNLLLGLSNINADICKSLEMKSRSMTDNQKSRFLFCLVSVFGFEAVGDALKVSADQLKSYLPLYLCSAELVAFHQLYSVDMIANCNKKELIHKVLSNQHNDPRIPLFCVRMCLEYNIWCSQIWDIILQRLTAPSTIEQLKDILESTQGKLMHMWHYKSYISAWNCVICNIFKLESVDESNKLHETKIVEKLYKTLLRCPCASSLNIESMWNNLKYFIHAVNEDVLKEFEPVSDISSFIQVLKSLKGNRI